MKSVVKNNKQGGRKMFRKGNETRKQRRKKERKMKKVFHAEKYNNLAQKRKMHYRNTSFEGRRGPGKYVRLMKPPRMNKLANVNVDSDESEVEHAESIEEEPTVKAKETPAQKDGSSIDTIAREIKREKNKLKKIQTKMADSRRRALIEANEEEDREIKALEKQLHLDKRKGKGLPSSFVSCGLDYILDVCNPEKRSSVVAAEKKLAETGGGFDEDFATVSGKSTKSSVKKSDKKLEASFDSESDIDSDDMSDFEDDIDGSDGISESEGDLDEEMSEESETDNDSFGSKNGDSDDQPELKKIKINNNTNKDKKKVTFQEPDKDESQSNDPIEAESQNNDPMEAESLPAKSKNDKGLWEDIYGRKRDRQGNIVQESGKYVPPHLRENSAVSMKKEEIERLRRRLKGLMNRLAEANLHSISAQIEEAYRDHSRHSVNEVLNQLLYEAVGMPSNMPERQVMEHSALVAILHANVGSEVGAYILQYFVKKFVDMCSDENIDVSDKTADNVLMFICHLFTFKVCSSGLVLELIGKVIERFGEKEVELVLVALRCVGFALRKDSPVALKDLIVRARTLAASVASTAAQSSRVKFLLEVLLTIKNNNVSKLPQHDPTMAEQLKKKLKSVVRQGNVTTPLHIPLSDLLQADERGRWWLVGSAWSGQGPTGQGSQVSEKESSSIERGSKISNQVADLARKLRISTDSRRAIFSALLTAEDCNEAFEKLMKLRGAMGRDVAAVIVHCVQSEATYNPFYAIVAEKLVNTNRQHQMSLQCTLWDKFKETDGMRGHQTTNLAKFMAHLFLTGALPLSVLKTVQFVDMTDSLVRLIRRCLLTVLLHKDIDTVNSVWTRVSSGKQLGTFRESIRLFLHHFVLKAAESISSDSSNESQSSLLRERILTADAILQGQV